MGLAVYAGQVYPIWAGNFDEAHFVNDVPAGNALSIYYQPMVIAAGPRIVSSTMGPVAASTTSFTGTLTTGSSLVTGVTSTAGLFAGERHYRHRSPVRRDDLDRQQFNLDHAVGGRDGQRRREPDRDR